MTLPYQSGFTWVDQKMPDAEYQTVREGDSLHHTIKQDIGYPGNGRGIDVGEGGSYQEDLAGTTIVYAFKYDASAASGSRFTEFDITAENTWLGDAGDRYYVGCTKKFWATRHDVGVAKTAEVLELYYWNGALTQTYFMGILKEAATPLGEAIFEQTAEDEYANLCPEIDGDWAATDDVLDEIPDTGESLYWICFQVPAGGLATPPRTDEIYVRGSDFDIKSDTSAMVYWGMARQAHHERVSISRTKSPAGTPTADIAVTSTQTQQFYDFRTNQNDYVSLTWKLPHGIDTACPVKFYLSYITDGAIDTADIELDVKKVQDGTALDVGQTSDYINTENITVAAGGVAKLEQLLGTVYVNDLFEDDELDFHIKRTDNNGNSFYPQQLVVLYGIWRLGEQV